MSSDESGSSETASSADRLDQLEARVNELEAENKRLQDAFDALAIPGIDTETRELEALKIGGLPIGRMIKNRVSEMDLEQRLKQYHEEHSDTEAHQPDPIASDRILPIHEWLLKIREDRAEQVPTISGRRGALIFEAFLAREKNGSGPVSATTNTYYLRSSDARQILLDEDDLPMSGDSKAIRRAFEAVAWNSREGGSLDRCDCNSLENCPHTMFRVTKEKGQNMLEVNKTTFRKHLEVLEREWDELRAYTSDDPQLGDADDSSPDDGTDHEVAEKHVDTVEQAERAEASETQSDTGVSSQSGPSSDEANGGDQSIQ